MIEQFLAACKLLLGSIVAANITISSDTFTATAATCVLTPQSGTTDNVARIAFGTMHDGALLTLTVATGKTVVVQHNQGGVGNIRLSGAASFTMAEGESITLRRSGTEWIEASRSTPTRKGGCYSWTSSTSSLVFTVPDGVTEIYATCVGGGGGGGGGGGLTSNGAVGTGGGDTTLYYLYGGLEYPMVVAQGGGGGGYGYAGSNGGIPGRGGLNGYEANQRANDGTNWPRSFGASGVGVGGNSQPGYPEAPDDEEGYKFDGFGGGGGDGCDGTGANQGGGGGSGHSGSVIRTSIAVSSGLELRVHVGAGGAGGAGGGNGASAGYAGGDGCVLLEWF